MRRPLLALAALLSLVVAGPALATGTGSPTIDEPVGSTPQYQGFHGPFEVSFEEAAPGTYSCWVEHASVKVADCTAAFAWHGTENPDHVFSTPALTAGSYTFVVHQDTFDVPNATLSFTVRGYAQPTCSVAVPRTVRLNSGEEGVTGRLTASCKTAKVTYASWQVQHVTRGLRNLMTFDHKSADTFSFFGPDPLGTYLIVPTAATNAAGDAIRQNTPRIDLRLDSRLGLRSKRAGKHVTLIATLTQYLRGPNRFGAWKRRPVTFSYRTCATCAWHLLAVRRTDAHGHAVLRVRAAKVRGYRVTAAGTSLTWAPYPKRARR